MGNRLSKIVTKTGDDGTTGLAGGGRIEKYSMRMEAIGTVDELNCFVGSFIQSINEYNPLQPMYVRIQNDLFDLGGELSMPDHEMIQPEHCDRLEQHIEQLNEELEPLKNFILPGGSEALARCHIVRTVARRAERRVVELASQDEMNKYCQMYLNRLSDLAFVTARWLAHLGSEQEVLWQPSPVVSKK